MGRRSGERDALILALGRTCLALLSKGRLEEAEDRLREARRVAEEAGDPEHPLVLEWRAQLASARGDLGARREAFAALMQLHRARGDLRRAAGAAANLADVYNRVGAYDRAIEALESAQADCQRVGHRVMEGYTLLNLGYAQTMQGRTDGALASLRMASSLANAMGESRLALLARLYELRARVRSRQWEPVVEEVQDIVDEAARLDMPALRVGALTVGAEAARELGQSERALAWSGSALSLRDELGGIEEDELEVFAVRARVLEDAGETDEARGVRARGRERLGEIARGIGDPALQSMFEQLPVHRELDDGATGPAAR
jgi:tetratricopeptide (TPR) repeat protein